MKPDHGLRSQILASIDPDEALALLRAAVAVPSVTGDEAAFARFVAEQLDRAGADGVTVQDFAAGRPNVWGTVHGAANAEGPGLLFAGHLDTVQVRGWAEHWRGDARENPFSGAVVDGQVWGRGVGDCKAGLCAVLSALRTLDRAGLQPTRDVTVVGVGDEESGEPGSGISAGIKAVVPQLLAGVIPAAGFAVYVEPTGLDVYTAQMGFFITEIRVQGQSAYFGTPELGVDALRAAHELLAALWAHSAELERRAAHPLVGRPFLLVTGVTAGGYIAVPGECTVSLIRKLLPGESLDQARAELDAVLASAVSDSRVRLQAAYTAPRDHEVGGTPNETDPDLEAVALLRAAVRRTRPDRGRIQGAPYWSEVPFLAKQLGIPAVYCAPGDITNCHTFAERVSTAEYLEAVGAFATFIADYCGVQPRTQRPRSPKEEPA